MKWFFILLFCTSTILADDAKVLISKLGNDSFAVREYATEELKLMDYEPIPALGELIRKTTDIEVKMRAVAIVNNYYHNCYLDVPSVWAMPKRFRTEGDADLCVKFYSLAREQLNVNNTYTIDNDDWSDKRASTLATILFYGHLASRYPKIEEISKLKLEMVGLQGRLEYAKNSRFPEYIKWERNLPSSKAIPGVIEDIIATEESEVIRFSKMSAEEQKAEIEKYTEPELAPDDYSDG